MNKIIRQSFILLSTLLVVSACAPTLDPQPPSTVTHPKAIAVYEKALAGDAQALFKLGNDYFEGINGFPKDKKKSSDAYELAAKKGHAEAYVGLGLAYALGYGRPVNPEKAIRCYQRAARRGSRTAIMMLQRLGKSVQSEKDQTDAIREELFKIMGF